MGSPPPQPVNARVIHGKYNFGPGPDTSRAVSPPGISQQRDVLDEDDLKSAEDFVACALDRKANRCTHRRGDSMFAVYRVIGNVIFLLAVMEYVNCFKELPVKGLLNKKLVGGNAQGAMAFCWADNRLGLIAGNLATMKKQLASQRKHSLKIEKEKVKERNLSFLDYFLNDDAISAARMRFCSDNSEHLLVAVVYISFMDAVRRSHPEARLPSSG